MRTVVFLALTWMLLGVDECAGPAMQRVTEQYVARDGAIAKALENYKWVMRTYPSTEDGLAILFKKKGEVPDPRFAGPYLAGTFDELTDPWGQQFEYRCPGKFNLDSYDLWSRGPNRQDDAGREGSDDIKNWTER